MPINLARIDDRLIHGQVVRSWAKKYDIEQVIIIDDKVANNKIQQSLLTKSAPVGLKVYIFGVLQFIQILKKSSIKRRTMLLFTSSVDAEMLVDNGLELNKLNVGGMRMHDGCRMLSHEIAVTPDEEQAFKNILAKNIAVEIQMVPQDPVVPLATLLYS